jgi:cytochrome c biogenesis protein CcmG, thiol:disulfide interchange protein DsbE
MNRKMSALAGALLVVTLLAGGCKTAAPAANQTGVTPGTPSNQGAASTPGISIGNRALDIQVQTMDGKSVNLSDFRGKPVLLNFWATWCPPCQFEVPFLQQTYESYASKGLVIMAVDQTNSRTTETADAVKNFAASYNLTMPVYLDANKTTMNVYALTGIPTTIMVDKDGIIKFKLTGAFPDKAAIDTALKTIMP